MGINYSVPSVALVKDVEARCRERADAYPLVKICSRLLDAQMVERLIPRRLKSKVYHGSTCNLDPDERKQVEHALSLQHAEIKSGLLNVRKLDQLVQHYMLQALSFPGEPSHFEACRAVIKRLFYLWTAEYHISSFSNVEHMIVTKIDKPVDRDSHRLVQSLRAEIDELFNVSKTHLLESKPGALSPPHRIMRVLFVAGQCAMLSSDHRSTAWLQLVSGCAYLLRCACLLIDVALSKYETETCRQAPGDNFETERLEGILLRALHQSFLCSLLPFVFTMVSLMEHHTELCIQLVPFTRRFIKKLCRLLHAVPRLNEELMEYQEGVVDQIRASVQASSFSESDDDRIWYIGPRDRLLLLLRMSASSLGYMLSGASRGKARSDEEEFSRPWLLSGLFSGGVLVEVPVEGRPIRNAWEDNSVSVTELVSALSSHNIAQTYRDFEDDEQHIGSSDSDIEMRVPESKEADTDRLSEFVDSMFSHSDEGFQATERGIKLRAWLSSHYKMNPVTRKKYGHDRYQTAEALMLAACIYHAGADGGTPMWHIVEKSLKQIGDDYSQCSPCSSLRSIWETVFGFRQWLMDMHSSYREAGGQIDELEQGSEEVDEEVSLDMDEDAKEEEMDHTAEEQSARKSRAMSDSSNRSSSQAPGLFSDRIKRINPVDHPTSFESFYKKLLQRLAFLCGSKTACTDWFHDMESAHTELDHCHVFLKPATKTPSVVELKSMSRHARSLHTLRPHPFRALHPREWMYERIATAVASSSQGLYGEDFVYTPIQRRCKAIEIYSKEGWAFPVEIAGPILFAQDTRAQQRTVAIRSMEQLCSQDVPPVVLRDILLPFRSSFRGMTEHEEISRLLPLVRVIGQTEHCVAQLLDRRMAISQPSGPSTPSHSFGRKGDHETGSQSSDHEFDPIRLRQQIESSFEDDEGNAVDDADEPSGGQTSEESNASVELRLPSKASRLVAMEHHPFSELDCSSRSLKTELHSYVDGLYKELKDTFVSLQTSSRRGRLLSLQPVVLMSTLDWRVVRNKDGDIADSACDNLRALLQSCYEAWLASSCTATKSMKTTAVTWKPVTENQLWLCLSRGMVSREQALAYIWSGIKERNAKVPNILQSSLRKAAKQCMSPSKIPDDFHPSLRSPGGVAYLGNYIDSETILLCYLHMIAQCGVLSRTEAQRMFEASSAELSLMQNTNRSIVSVPSVGFLRSHSRSPYRDLTVNSIGVDSSEINASAQVITQCSGIFETDDISLFSKQLFGLYGLLSIHHLGECFAKRQLCSFLYDPLHLMLAAALKIQGDRLLSLLDTDTAFGEWNCLCFLAASGERDALIDRLHEGGLVSSVGDAKHVAWLTSTTDGAVLTRLSGKMLYFIRSLLDQPERYTNNDDFPTLKPIWSPQGLAILFALLVYGGLPQQKAVLPLLHLVLPSVTPVQAGSALQSITDDSSGSSVKRWLQNDGIDRIRATDKTSESVPLLLLSLMGRKRCFFPINSDQCSLATDLHEGGFGFGHQLSSVCSLVVGVLRTLLRLRSVNVTVQNKDGGLSVGGCQARVSSWGRNIMNVLRRLLESGKRHLNESLEASEQMSSVLGSAASALWAVGGLPELLRPGSRVVQRQDSQSVPVSPEGPAESGEEEMMDESNANQRTNEATETSARVENEDEEDVGVVVVYERGSSLALVALPCGDITASSTEEDSAQLSCGSKNFLTCLTEGTSTAAQYARLKQGIIQLSSVFLSPADCDAANLSTKVSLPSFHNEELNLACEKALKSIVEDRETMDSTGNTTVETTVLLNHQSSLDSWELVWQPLNQLQALDEVPLIDYSLNLKAKSMQNENPVPDVCIGEGFLELLSEFAAFDLPQTALHAILQHQYHTRTRHFPPLREICSEQTLYTLTWVWKMKAMATSAISSIFRQQSHHVETAIFQKVLPTLMETALRPLPLPSRGPGFLDASNLAHIVHVTWERALESHLSRNSVSVWGLSKTIRSSGLSTKDLDCSDVPESLSINVGGTRSLANALFLHRDYLTEGLDALPVYNVKDADIPAEDTDAAIPDDGNAEPGTSLKPSDAEEGDSSGWEPDESFNESMSAPPPGVDLDTWNSAYDIIEVSCGRSIEDCYIALKKNSYSKDSAALWLLSHPPSHPSVAAERERLRLVQESTSKKSTTSSSRKKVNASAVVEGVHMNEPLISQNGLVASDASIAPSKSRHTVSRQPTEQPVATGQSIVESIPGLLVASDAPLVCMSEAILLPVARPQKLRPGTLVAIMASPVIAATDSEFRARLRRGRLAGRDIDPHAKRDRGTVLKVAYPLASRFLGAGALAVGTVAPPHVSEAYRRYWDSLSAYLGTEERQYSSQELVFIQYRVDEAGFYRTVAVPYDHIRLVVGSYGEDVSVSSMTCGEALHLWGRMNVGNEDEDEEQFLRGLEETQDKGNNPAGATSKPVGTTTEQDELSSLDTDSWVSKVLSTNGNDPKKTAQALGFGQIPLLCRAYESYAVQSARHACLHVLLQWPGSVSFDAAHLGGPKSLLDFAKVIVSGADGMFSGEGARLAVITQKISENIGSVFAGAGNSVGYSLLSQQSSSTSSTLAAEGKANFMLHSAKDCIPALRRQIANLVKSENLSSSGATANLWLCSRCGLKNKGTSACRACGERHDGHGRTTEFTPVLINDAKSNMKVISVQSSEDGQSAVSESGIAIAESNHPATVNKKSFIHISGATAMWITFDANTCTDPNDPTAYLAFYLDASRTHCVAMFSGRAHSFKPFLVRTPTGKLFYTHCPGKPGVGDTHWGFRLKAHRANGMAWGGERETLRSPSLEWGTWLVEFLLSECLPQTTLSKGVIHNASLVSVMLKHICSHAAPFKQRIVALLCRVLSQPSYFSQNDHPPLHIILNEIKPVLDQKLQEAPSTGLVFLPTALLQVYELVATASAAHYMLGNKWQFFTPVTSLVPAPFRRLRESFNQEEGQECQEGVIDLSGTAGNWFPPVKSDCSAPELPELQALRALKAMVFAREILKSLAVGARIPDAWLYRAAELAHDGGPVSNSEDSCRVAPGRSPFNLTDSSLAKLQQAMVAISGLSLAYRTGMLTASTSTDESLKRPVAELKRAALWNIPIDDVQELVPGLLQHHSHRIDEELVEWASMKASTEEIRVSTLSVWKIELSEQERHTYPALNCLTVETLRLRLALIVILNKLLARCLTVVDTSGSVGEWSVGALLKQVSHLIFPETQSDVIESAIEQSSTYEESGIHISLDNTAAEKSVELGKSDINNSQCMFVQLFNKLRHCRAKTLRSRLDDKDRLFKVSFLNEAGIDWGGIYRDCIARAVHDLFTLPSPHVNLCKRARSALLAEEQGNAADDDTWVPNTSLLQGAGASTTNSKLALYMLQFVGVLMGISWRSRAWLDFMFAPCVWKLIAGDETQLDESDIEMLDPDKGALLKRLKAFLTRMQIEVIRGNSVSHSKMWEDEFAECFPDLYFVDEDSRGRPEELITNGASTRVTASTASSFCQMIAERRLGPLRKPTRAIRKGLLNIIPERAVQLCRWKDLQRMVCGPSEIDMAMLQRHTKYISPFNPNHYLIKAFWNVFGSLSMRERSMLIRYAWGRSKLPRGESNWYTADGRRTHFLLTPFLDNNQEFRGNESMVEAHTCFFQLKLPMYSSEEVLRDKLMKSVAYGLARGTFDIA
eukprot:gb/GECG01013331.1/.p1 GENE.gb/GECG01013331.1/~~gb/GECG01013331.1/.p1  ORF type:complete len:3653 (+),score=418.50 gb/GECG01013331.1/:1-10959(+)